MRASLIRKLWSSRYRTFRITKDAQVNQEELLVARKARQFYLLQIPDGLWQEISINIIGPLPRSNDKNTIVIIVDQF